MLAACSLAGDVTPPPGAPVDVISAPLNSANEPAAPVEGGLGYPIQPPSVAQGAAIYAEHCAACHGSTGKGDGPAAAQLLTQRTTPLPDFSTPDHFLHHSQAELFQIVTEGRLEYFMPPWANTLSEAERWSVVAYLYSLSAPKEQQTQGQTLYDENCAACHGVTGAGDGPQANGLQLPNFSQPAYSAPLTQRDLYDALNTHKAVTGFPTLTEAERWAIVFRLRTLAFDMGNAPPVMAATEKRGAVSGRVVNGTPNTTLPPHLQVTLHGFDNFIETQTLTTTLNADGSFKFEAVPSPAGRQFMLTAEYGGLTYSSDIFNFSARSQVNGLALTVYATTSERSIIQVERVHLAFDYGSNTGQVGVAEMWLMSNRGDKTFVPDLQTPLEIPLPAGASGLVVQNLREGVDYVRTVNGFQLQLPLRPGANSLQLSFSFNLPYAQPLVFSQPMPYAVSGLNILLPSADFTVQSANGLAFVDEGVQARQGTPFRSYSVRNVPANTVVDFRLSSAPTAGAGPAWLTYLLMGLLAVGVITLGLGVWQYQRTTAQFKRETLLQAIADLDDAFAAGQLETSAYERERTRLKAQL